MKAFANEMSYLRRSKGLSQHDLAQIITKETGINVDQRTISSWEIGNSFPRPFQYQFLEDFFGVPKEDIFKKAFEYKPNNGLGKFY